MEGWEVFEKLWVELRWTARMDIVVGGCEEGCVGGGGDDLGLGWKGK